MKFKPTNYILLIFLLFGCAPMLLKIFYVRFIPSQEWATSTGTIAIVFGVVAGAAATGFAFATSAQNPELANASVEKLWFVGISVFVCTWMAGWLLVRDGIPMVHAAILGDDIRLPYIVAHTRDFDSRGCSRAIKLEGMPFSTNSLCGLSETLRAMLSKGDTVYAVGRGTDLGVFYDSVMLEP